jgi:cytochrome c oxidase assembly protein subunit 15
MKTSLRPVLIWLMAIVVMVGLMVLLGGITRITGSGLSITEWKPIMGVIPPLNESDWQTAFAKYQAIPQYRIINQSMTLTQFKWIFFWEFSHRLVARLVGVVFLIPFLVFLVQKRIPRRWIAPLLGLFFLGGMQGALGWFMVSSGLSELTYVSHFRLAAHLTLAFFIGMATLWVFKSMWDEAAPEARIRRGLYPALRQVPLMVGILLFVQVVYGAFTAGLKSGYMYLSFPTFYGEWVPKSLLEMTPTWLNFLSNPLTVQWVHRILGTVLVLLGLGFWIVWRKTVQASSQRLALALLAHGLAVQYLMGVLVVLYAVPVWLGALHQITGYVLCLLATNFWYEFRSAR